MPGIVVFKRRWSVGSDDLVVPGAFLLVLHLIWIVVLAVLLGVVTFDLRVSCILTLWKHVLGYLAILSASLLVELFICIVAMRGSILDTEARASMQYLLYVRLGVMVTELVWLVLGVVWLVMHYQDCPIDVAKEAILGIVICNWCVILSVMVTVWCTYDAAGGSWVKMKKYQQSMKESESRFQYKRSAGNRNWRQRKVIRAYQDSWDHRCRLLFCCMRNSDRNRNSFSDIARLLSDFFRDLDVVPSDVVAGLVLLRKFQKIEREAIVKQRKNETYEYLSGVAVTTNTQFLALSDPDVLERYQQVVYYMHFALGAYGWPMFLVSQGATGLCKLCSRLRCLCVPCGRRNDEAVVIKDNCCGCNYAALRHLTETGDVRVTYATYHVDVGETPFFVAVDVARKKVVLAIRGTLSMKDVITDLNAEGEPLPVNPPRDDWLGHKGMVLAAEYIRHKIKEESILETAFNLDPAAGTQDFGLVLVGHSLGAGTAAILAILLRPEYPSLLCFSYSPPGGSLSMSAVEYTKSFITSVVVGKDVVPRIGLHQLESLRADLINTIKRSKDPKWKTIVCSAACCGCHSVPTSAAELRGNTGHMRQYQQDKDLARDANTHPNDSSVALTVHQPLYPPGRIIHIVRHHPTATEQKYETRWRQVLSKHEPVYQAVWANNTDFDEVLISPVMIQDHMPDNVLDALNKVITLVGPAKPQRTQSLNNSAITSTEHLDSERCRLLTAAPTNLTILNSPSSPKPSTPPHKLCLETSFTSLQSPSENQNHSLDSSINSQSLPNTRTSLINTLTNLQNMPTRSRSQISHTNPNITWEYSSLMEGGVTKNVNLSTGFLKGLRRVDLIHDDWLGLAPLATPESLSEVSSNSSRAGSLVLNIDKALKGGLLGHKRSGSSISSYDDTPAKKILPQIRANNLGVDNGASRGPFNGNIVSADKNVVSGNTSSGDTSFRSAKMSSGEIFEGSSNYESATNGNSEEDLLTVNQFSSADSITVNVDVHTNPADFVPETDGIVSSSPKTVKFAIESQDSIEDNDSPTMQMYNKMNTDSKTSGKEMNLGKVGTDVGKLDDFDLRRNDNFRFPCFDEAAVSSSSSNFTSPLTDDFSYCSGNNNIAETLADQSADSLIKEDVELRRIQKDLNTNKSLPLLSNIGEVHGDARKKYVITSVGKGESSV